MFYRVRCFGLTYLFVCLILTLWGCCATAVAQVTGWGDNSSGELSGPTGLTNVKQVASGSDVTIVLYTNGSLGAFGADNATGIVSQLPSGSDFTQISCTHDTGLALKDDGTVVAWGYNGDGEATLPNGLSNVIAVSAGKNFSMALKDDGTVVAWGDNTFGESTVPNGLSNVIQICAGNFVALALKSDGTVVAWGAGLGGTSVPNNLTGVVGIATTSQASIALLSNGTVVTWGDNTYGEQNVPSGLSGVIGVSGAFTGGFAALKSNGTVVAWGSNNGVGAVPANLYGVTSLVVGESDILAIVGTQSALAWGDSLSGELAVPPIYAAKSVSGGDGWAIALQSNGIPVAWGEDGNGETSVPVGISGVTQIAAGTTHALALLDNGTVVGWGTNFSGETTIPSGLTGVKQIAAGQNFSLALLDDGTVQAWGDNTYGETTLPTFSSGVKAITCGTSFALALLDNGTVVAWGANGSGQATVPGALADVASVAAGYSHSLALLSNGTITGWGDNTFSESSSSATGVVQVTAGYIDSGALLSNGTVSLWGFDPAGETNSPAGLSGCTQLDCAFDSGYALAPPAVTSVSFTSSTVVGGNAATCNVTVSPAAGPAGETVTISGTGPLTLPTSVTVPAGSETGTFQISTSVVPAQEVETVTATLGSTSASGNLTIGLLTMTSIAFSSGSVEGGQSDTATVTISGDPGPAGATVALSGSGPWSIPATITIPGGSASTTFAVSTSPVSSDATETVTASISGASDTQVITESGASGGTVTLTFNGQTTAPLAYNATASQVQTSLNGLSSIGGAGGSVTCSGGPLGSGAITCTFGGSLSSGVQPLISGVVYGGPGQITVNEDAFSNASFTTTPALITAFSCNPSSVIGGQSSVFTVTLDSPAGPSGDVVSLTGFGDANLPLTVTVPAGKQTVSFTASTYAESYDDDEEIRASLGSSNQSTVLYILPVTVSTLTLGQQSATGGSNVEATITLSAPAQTGGLDVALSSNSPSATVPPADIFIPGGATTYSFVVKTSPVSSSTSAILAASVDYEEKDGRKPVPPQVTAKLQVLPATVSNLVCAVPSVTGGSNAEVQVGLSGIAGPSGNVVTLSSSSAAVILPASITVPAGQSTSWFLAKTSKVTSSTKATLTATTGTVTKTASLTVTAAALASITATPDSVIAGADVETTVTLGGPAGSSGVTLGLTSTSPAAPVPSSANISKGADSYSFLIKTQGVATSTLATITATVGSAHTSTTLTINPAGIVSLSVTPGSATGIASPEAVVTLNGIAPPGGAVVSLSSNSASVRVPGTVTVPAGKNHYSFLVKTSPVSRSTQATITAKLGNTFGTASVTVTP